MLLPFAAFLGRLLFVATLSLRALDPPPLILLAGLALSLFAGLALLFLSFGTLLDRQLLVATLLLLTLSPLPFGFLASLAFLLGTLNAPLGVPFLVATL